MACSPKTLLAAAACFQCLGQKQLAAIRIYLLCKLAFNLVSPAPGAQSKTVTLPTWSGPYKLFIVSYNGVDSAPFVNPGVVYNGGAITLPTWDTTNNHADMLIARCYADARGYMWTGTYAISGPIWLVGFDLSIPPFLGTNGWQVSYNLSGPTPIPPPVWVWGPIPPLFPFGGTMQASDLGGAGVWPPPLT